MAVFGSSALFGAAHVFNLLAHRQPLLSNLTQIAYGFFFGVIFAACVLRNNAIWPMMVAHAAVDFGGSLLREIAISGPGPVVPANSTPTEALVSIAITLPLLLYGAFILRKVRPYIQTDLWGFPLKQMPA